MSDAADRIKSRALELGFDVVGIAPADYGEHCEHFRRWLDLGRHAEMTYLARNADARTDLGQVLPGCKSVVCVGMSYSTGELPKQRDDDPLIGRISRYALNEDYHAVMAEPLAELAAFVGEVTGGRTKTHIDTGPVLEKALAERAGLGWIGRNTCLIARKLGSWLFLGEVLVDVELPADSAHAGYCSSCQACVQACPTGALGAPRELDARKCLSYLTIEHKGTLPTDLRLALGNRVYGCDMCQEVCPWNVVPTATQHAAFRPREDLLAPKLTELLALTPEEFRERFRGNPIHRIKRKRFLRNVAVALGNSGDPAIVPHLQRALSDEEPLIREHAEWALSAVAAGGER